jgi:hypothetical protein
MIVIKVFSFLIGKLALIGLDGYVKQCGVNMWNGKRLSSN